MTTPVLYSADLVIHLDNEQIEQGGITHTFEPKVFAVLRCLLAEPGVLVSKEQLQNAVWAEAVVSDHALNYAISRLRKTLGDQPQQPRYIQTISKRGYRWLPAVTNTATASLALPRTPLRDALSPSPVAPKTRPRKHMIGALVLGVALFAAVATWLTLPRELATLTQQPRWFNYVGQRGNEASGHLLAGRRALQKRRADQIALAVNEFAAAVKTAPDHAEAWAALSVAHSLLAYYLPYDQRERDTKAARDAADKALTLAPQLAVSHAAAGLAELYGGSRQAAEREFKLALERDPRHVDALHWLGEMYLDEHRYDDAAHYLAQAVAADPLSAIVQETMGINEFERGDLDKASAYFRRAIELEPEMPGGYRSSARVLALRGQWAEALQANQQAFARGYRRPTAYFDIAALLQLGGQRESARAWAKAGEQEATRTRFRLQEQRLSLWLAVPESADVLALTSPSARALQASHRGDFAAAVTLYRQVEADELWWQRSIRYGGFSHALYLAAALQQTGAEQEANALLERLRAELDNDSLRGFGGRAYVLAQRAMLLQQPNVALQALQHAFELGFGDLDRLRRDPFLQSLYPTLGKQTWFLAQQKKIAAQQKAARAYAQWLPPVDRQ